MSVVFGLGTRLRVRMRTKLASFTTDSNHRVLRMAYIDQGEFEAMNLLSGWGAARSDEHQFHVKIKVSTLAVFELSSFDKWSEQRKKEGEKRHFRYRTLLRLAVFRVAFGQPYESC